MSAAALTVLSWLDPHLFWLGWVCLVPFMLALDELRRWPHVLVAAVVVTMAFTTAVFGWFAIAMAGYSGISTIVAWSLLVLAAPLLQPQFIVFAWVRWRTRSASLAIIAWMLVESLYPKLFHDSIGHGAYASRALRQCADLAGSSLLTLGFLTVNVALASAIGRHRLWPAAIAVTVVVVMMSYGQLRLRSIERRPSSAVRVGLVQANLTHYAELAERLGTYDATVEILELHERLSRQAIERGAELVVWPETVYPTTFGTPKSAAGRELDDRIRAFASAIARPLVFGAYDSDGTHEYNAVYVLDSGHETVYRKIHPFPLTEYAPGGLRSVMPWLGDLQRGTMLVVAETRAGKLTPLVCYDVLDASLTRDAARRGAELFITVSNDSWFPPGSAPELHLMEAAFRSIETRRPQARAANTGISALINAVGDVEQRTSFGTRATLVGDLQLIDEPPTTLATRWGHWLEPLLALIGAALVARRLRRANAPKL